jgi:secondary thiamine-phosphate synthase enzyme
MHTALTITTKGQGLYEFTEEVHGVIHGSTVGTQNGAGIAHLFLAHTSASLIIQENADPSARCDLERWLTALVPEGQSGFSHTTEGPDDMPAHIKSVLTGCSLTIPIINGSLALGTWQGIYLWEHRRAPHRRRVIVSVMG